MKKLMKNLEGVGMNTNKILIGLIVVLIALSFPAQAQNDGWSSALEVPGAQTLTEGTADFTECFIAFNHCGGPWYKCEDTEGFYPKKGAQNVTGEHVWAQVHKDFDFTITNSSPGRLYMIFESHEGVTIGTTKKGKDGKWQGVSVSGLVRSAIYYGTELRYIAEPLRYKINPSGSIEFGPSQNIPVHVGPDQWLKPGQFRVTLVAGRPYNYNTGICAYVPSSGNVKVLFIPDVPEVTDSDKDGVPDDKDDCPNTQTGVSVDEKGCVVGGPFTWSTIEPGSNFIIEPDTKLLCDDIEKPLPVDVFGGSEVTTFDKYTQMLNDGVDPEIISRVKVQDLLDSEYYRIAVWDDFLWRCENALNASAWLGRRANFILGCGTGYGSTWSSVFDSFYAYADTRIQAVKEGKSLDEAHELGKSAAKRKGFENIAWTGFSKYKHFNKAKQGSFNTAKQVLDWNLFDPLNTGQVKIPTSGGLPYPKMEPANVKFDPFFGKNQPVWRPKYEH